MSKRTFTFELCLCFLIQFKAIKANIERIETTCKRTAQYFNALRWTTCWRRVLCVLEQSDLGFECNNPFGETHLIEWYILLFHCWTLNPYGNLTVGQYHNPISVKKIVKCYKHVSWITAFFYERRWYDTSYHIGCRGSFLFSWIHAAWRGRKGKIVFFLRHITYLIETMTWTKTLAF